MSLAATQTQTAGFPEPCSVHELKTLVLSRHPAIVIETTDEGRADAQLAAVASDTGLTVFDWTITQGLVRQPGTQAMYGTTDPALMLANLAGLTVPGLFVLKDFSVHLSAPAVCRAFRELLERFADAPSQLSTFVLLGASVELPAEIESEIVRYDLRLPDRDEYRQAIGAVVESLQANGRAEVALRPGDYDAFASALSGLTINQARQAIAQVAIEDGRLAPDDLTRIIDLKSRVLRNDSLLEYFPVADNGFELGGFANLRCWWACRAVASRWPPRSSRASGNSRCSSSTPAGCTTSTSASPRRSFASRSRRPSRWPR